MFKPEETWDQNSFPLAYLITFRTFGTWLHGDERDSVDTHKNKNIYGTPKISPSKDLQEIMNANMSQMPVVFDDKQRQIVEGAIKEVCKYKKFYLHAVNVRTNHVHAVVSAGITPEIVADIFKKYATRKLRGANLLEKGIRPWSRGRSRKYLWKDEHVAAAIDYVLYGQGDIPFEIYLKKHAS
jgi:REP element-mobilizing transposase RayT